MHAHPTHQTQVSCIVPVGEPIFQPFPHEVTFQAYEPYKTYEARLRLRNNDIVSAAAFCVWTCVSVCACVCACVCGYASIVSPPTAQALSHTPPALYPTQVSRRIKVSAPDSQFFTVRRANTPGKEDGGKVASGMETAYIITFKPQVCVCVHVCAYICICVFVPFATCPLLQLCSLTCATHACHSAEHRPLRL